MEESRWPRYLVDYAALRWILRSRHGDGAPAEGLGRIAWSCVCILGLAIFVPGVYFCWGTFLVGFFLPGAIIFAIIWIVVLTHGQQTEGQRYGP